MCFSATASFTAATVLGGIGLAAHLKVRERGERLLASVPLLFAAQQLAEGFVWLSLRDGGDPATLRIASKLFLLFATGLWPALAGLMAALPEPHPGKRRLMFALAGVGALLGAWLYGNILPHDVVPFCEGDTLPADAFSGNLSYPVGFIPFGTLARVVYLVVCTVPLVLSSNRRIAIFGVLLALSFALAYMLYSQTFISVWCFFGAALSAWLYGAIGRQPASGRIPEPAVG